MFSALYPLVEVGIIAIHLFKVLLHEQHSVLLRIEMDPL
jgi:hypothetical protein